VGGVSYGKLTRKDVPDIVRKCGEAA